VDRGACSELDTAIRAISHSIVGSMFELRGGKVAPPTVHARAEN
jgi:hypothetical protein